MSFHQEIYALRPWYHDFKRLGLQTDFGDMQSSLARRLRLALRRGEWLSLKKLLMAQPSSHLINQRHKEEVLLPYLSRCLSDLGEQPTCLELFCADGYYGCLVKSRCAAAHVTGVERNAHDVLRAQTAARVLGFDAMTFIEADVWDYLPDAPRFDLVLCTGGLYHLSDPRRLLQLVRPITKAYLVLQTVVTLESEAPDFFVTPAPGWRHGSRFTHAAVERWLAETGWVIADQTRNELTGNERLIDRGSSYFICRPLA